MEFVSGYRDEFLDFTALLFGWYRKFVAERGAGRTSLEVWASAWDEGQSQALDLAWELLGSWEMSSYSTCEI
ncbi:hypothetical protein CB1_000479007 [Camelus ferus]|nr:hypothetical protein CB1_000479007 [Camelus ferus]